MNARRPRAARRHRALPWLLATCCAWPAPAAETPDPALLEYLGDWQGAEGAELDPALLDTLPPDESKPAAGPATEDRADED